jgi:hypothetical protein
MEYQSTDAGCTKGILVYRCRATIRDAQQQNKTQSASVQQVINAFWNKVS